MTTYPPWMRQRLRAEIFKAFIEMGQRRLPVDPDFYALVQSKLADAHLCGTHATASAPMPAPLSPTPTASRKRSASLSLVPTTKAKKTKAAFEVQRVVREEGGWGGHRRWFVVEWSHEGYEPSWEAWRSAGGEVGSPVLTWMPLKEVINLIAFREWEEAAEERAQQQEA